MKKRILIIIFSCFSLAQVHAQMETYNWHFANNSHISFTSGSPVLIPGSQIRGILQEGVSSMSDGMGNVLFYTEGDTVWNSNNVVMPNGTGLAGYISTSQGALIVPSPGNASQYYIFSLKDIFGTQQLRYSIIDMTLVGGLGNVTVKNVLVADSMTEKQIAVRHSNGIDFWLITHKRLSNEFQVYLINTSGVAVNPITSAVGSVLLVSNQSVGCMKASRSGNKIASACYNTSTGPAGFFEVYDFDNNSGIVSNPVMLQSAFSNAAYSVEFSPDEHFLYGCSYNDKTIYQFDLQSPSPVEVLVGSPTYFIGDMLLAPDGKIYVALQYNTYLGIINAPDSAGTACNFVQNGFNLGTNTCAIGLPNMIHDLITLVNVETPSPDAGFSIYPNPANDEFTISNFQFPIQKIEIINLLGEVAFSSSFQTTSNTIKLQTSNLPPGLYIIKVYSDKEVFQQKLVIW